MASILGKKLQKLMYNLGYLIGKWPSYFIIIPLFLCLLFATGLQNIKHETNVDYLYLPSDGKFANSKSSLNELYPMNYSTIFSKDRLIDNSKFGKVIVTAKDNLTVFREQVFWEIVLLDRIIRNLTIDYDDFQLTFDDICAKLNEQCYNSNTVLDLAYQIKEIESNRTLINYPVWFNTDSNITYYLHNQIGGLSLSDKSVVLNAQAIQLNYYLDLSIKYGNELANLWESKFIDVLKSLEDQFEHLNIASYTSFSTSQELDQNLRVFNSRFGLTLALILVYGFFSGLMFDCVRSKQLIGILQGVLPLLGLASAFGFCAYAHIEMIEMNWAIVYILLGNAMQETFFLIAVWRRTLIQLSVRERLAETYSEAMSAITINAMIHCSFYGASYFLTNIRAMQVFCIYICSSLICVYLVQLTLFGGLIAIFGYIERRNLHSLICVPVISKSSSSNKRWIYKVFCTGGINANDPDNRTDNRPHMLMIFFRDQFAKLINNKFLKCLILLAFIGHLSIGIFSIGRLNEGLNRVNLFNEESYARKFIDYDQKYFISNKYPIQIIINETLDYSNAVDQFRIEQLINKVENSDFIFRKSAQCWIRSYLRFVQLVKQQRNRSVHLAGYNLNLKDDFYNLLKNVFLSMPANFIYRSDIVFSENLNEIISSRCIVFSGTLHNSTDEKEMMDALHSIADASKLNITFYNPNFGLFEQYSQVKGLAIDLLVLLTIILTLICILFLPSINTLFFLILITISIELGYVSYLNIWNVNLDYISMLILMMNIAFSVNCLIQVSFAHFESINFNIKKKIRNTLFTVGYPLLQSYSLKLLIFSTLTVTSLSSSYLYLAFSKAVIVLIALSAFHSLLLLPVLLSLNNSFYKKVNYSNEKHHDLSDLDLDDQESENDFDYKSRKSYYKSNVRQRLNEQPAFYYTEKWFDGKQLTTNRCSTVTIPRLIMNQPNKKDKLNDDLNFLTGNKLSTVNSRAINKLDQAIEKPAWIKDQDMREDVIKKFNEFWNLNLNRNDFQLKNNKQQTGLQVNMQSNESSDLGLGTSAEENSEGSWKLNKDEKLNQNISPKAKHQDYHKQNVEPKNSPQMFNGKTQYTLFGRPNQQPPLPPIPTQGNSKAPSTFNQLSPKFDNSQVRTKSLKKAGGIPGASSVLTPPFKMVSTYNRKKKSNQDWINN